MCGRYTLTELREQFVSQFGSVEVEELAFTPRFNIAPTQRAPVLRVLDRRLEVIPMGWGFLPKWSHSPIINAMQETLADKPTFKDAFMHRRCLVPADGFFEWQKTQGRKLPVRFVLPTRAVFYFAGLWDTFAHPKSAATQKDLFPATDAVSNDRLLTFLIITTPANDIVRPVHTRMPVIVRPEVADTWLDPVADLSTLNSVLRHPRNDELVSYTVSPLVNNVRNDSPQCIVPN